MLCVVYIWRWADDKDDEDPGCCPDGAWWTAGWKKKKTKRPAEQQTKPTRQARHSGHVHIQARAAVRGVRRRGAHSFLWVWSGERI